MTPDEERLQRYLEWQRSRDADRAQRRRRMVGYAAVPAVCVLALGFGVWLARPWLDRAQPVTAITTPQSLPRAVESPPMPRERRNSEPLPETQAPAPQEPAVHAPELPVRTRPRPAPPVAARAKSRPQPRPEPVPAPAPSTEAATETEVAAAVAPTPVPPPVSPLPEPPRESPPNRWPSDVVAAPSQPDDAVETQAEPNRPTAGGAVAVGTPTVRERVTRWAKGEVQEFRDGVKRELRGFRSGYEKVRDFFGR